MDDPNSRRAAARVGQVLNQKYELRALLGSGAMGAVYRAWHPFLEREVAIKILHADLLGSKEHMSRFHRESRMASALNHPNIVSVFDGGHADDGAPYLVQELLDGEDLSKMMDRGRLGMSDAFDITLQLLDALAAAHKADIVHRDVKPENVFLVQDERGKRTVKLVDFGIGKRNSASDASFMTDPGVALGTPHYMSPEQVLAHNLDARSDIYAVGALLYHALAGEPVVNAETIDELLVKIVRDDAPSLATKRSDLPEWLVLVVDKALRRDPELRFSHATEMADAIQNRGEPTSIQIP